jgi:uncharacterized OB-fold protein
MAEMSPAMREFAGRVRRGLFELQRCAECGAVSWPPRDACASCWSERLEWAPVAPTGTAIAATTLHVSLEERFRSHAPWRVGSVRLDAGPVVYAHFSRGVVEGGAVRVEARIDFAGRAIVVALAPAGRRVEDDRDLADLISHEGGNDERT